MLILTYLEYSLQILEKYPNIKFHENPYSGSRVVSCGRTDGRTDGQADMTKLNSRFSQCCFMRTDGQTDRHDEAK